MYIINTLSHDFSRAIWNKQALVNFSRNYLNLMLSSTKMVSIHFPLSRSRVSYLCSRNFFVSFHATNDSWAVITLEILAFFFFCMLLSFKFNLSPHPPGAWSIIGNVQKTVLRILYQSVDMCMPFEYWGTSSVWRLSLYLIHFLVKWCSRANGNCSTDWKETVYSSGRIRFNEN